MFSDQQRSFSVKNGMIGTRNQGVLVGNPVFLTEASCNVGNTEIGVHMSHKIH